MNHVKFLIIVVFFIHKYTKLVLLIDRNHRLKSKRNNFTMADKASNSKTVPDKDLDELLNSKYSKEHEREP